MNAVPQVSIVILNWNGRKYLEQFLPGVMASEYDNLRVIIADNASTDDSVLFIKEKFPHAELIVFENNSGYAKGYNDALKLIDTDYYILLNSDVEVQGNWIKPVIGLMESNAAIAACQPKILSYQEKDLFEYAGAAGGWIDAYGYPFARGRVFDTCEKDTGQYDQSIPVFWASGAAMFVKAAVFHEMNGFDEYFFAHQEEIDLCWRMQLAGYKVYCCADSVVYHVGGGTLPQGNTLKTWLNFRNNQVMLYKNLSWSEKWWKIPFRVFLDAVSAWKGLLSGQAGYFFAVWRAHLAFLKWILFYRSKSIFPEIKKAKPEGVFRGNMVWQYFVKKKRYFNEIVKNKTL